MVTVLATKAAWLVLAVAGLVHALGEPLPRLAALACALVGVPVALVAAVHAAASWRRGPTILAFGLPESVPCCPADAAFVRAAAQLRGTMGGAGYLHPGRRVLPTVAWLAAAAVGLDALSPWFHGVVGPWPVLVAIGAALAAFAFPARRFFYRETTGGGVVVSPPSAAFQLMRRAARARGESFEAPGRPVSQAGARDVAA
jgi:hypothetical protein